MESLAREEVCCSNSARRQGEGETEFGDGVEVEKGRPAQMFDVVVEHQVRVQSCNCERRVECPF